MSAEIENVERKVDGLRAEFTRRFDTVQKDLHDLTAALRDLVRIDGDIQRQNDAMARL